jgi:hypothetical protein
MIKDDAGDDGLDDIVRAKMDRRGDDDNIIQRDDDDQLMHTSEVAVGLDDDTMPEDYVPRTATPASSSGSPAGDECLPAIFWNGFGCIHRLTRRSCFVLLHGTGGGRPDVLTHDEERS